MPGLYQCPCCGADTEGRKTPLTHEDAAAAYYRMRWRGLTREAMLGEHRTVLDAIAPGIIAWIETNTLESARSW